MKRQPVVLTTILCIGFACSCSARLTNQYAFNELTKYHSPKLETLYLEGVRDSTGLGANIRDLLNTRNIHKKRSGPDMDVYSALDDAGREVGVITHYRKESNFNINVSVVRTAIGNVTNILEDRRNNMAVVTYTIIREPIEPYYSRFCIDQNCKYHENVLKKTNTANIYFRNYDDGWKIER
ncbi:MAG: hypothetical protein AB1346_04995 [Thermodesulfobacteriota bacterium]